MFLILVSESDSVWIFNGVKSIKQSGCSSSECQQSNEEVLERVWRETERHYEIINIENGSIIGLQYDQC